MDGYINPTIASRLAKPLAQIAPKLKCIGIMQHQNLVEDGNLSTQQRLITTVLRVFQSKNHPILILGGSRIPESETGAMATF